MKILIDMNLSPTCVMVFEEAEIEAVHRSQVGDPRTTDREIMHYAIVHNYVIFTNDLDFGTLLAATAANLPSVIQVRTQDLLPAAIGNLVISALERFRSEIEMGSLITLDTLRSRVKILPIDSEPIRLKVNPN
jgi:predicted nuclease of predicted toxin-antitoxin system